GLSAGTPSKVDDRHPQEQGLKLLAIRRGLRGGTVDDRHPQEQGLKLCRTHALETAAVCRRPSSTRTRIETRSPIQSFGTVPPCRRPSSTRTRIETPTRTTAVAPPFQRRRPSSTRTRIETRTG